MPRIILVRHAPTPETGRKLTGRLPGVGLGDAGVTVAEAARDALAGLRPARLVSSPVQRCVETATVIGVPHGLEPTIEPGLEEVDFGRWQGRTLASLAKLKAWRTVQVAPSRFTFPEGEAFIDVQHRAVAAVEALAADAGARDTVIACSHADVIKLVLSHYLGQPLDLFQRIGVAPASISVVDLVTGAPAHVVQINGRHAP